MINQCTLHYSLCKGPGNSQNTPWLFSAPKTWISRTSESSGGEKWTKIVGIQGAAGSIKMSPKNVPAEAKWGTRGLRLPWLSPRKPLPTARNFDGELSPTKVTSRNPLKTLNYHLSRLSIVRGLKKNVYIFEFKNRELHVFLNILRLLSKSQK